MICFLGLRRCQQLLGAGINGLAQGFAGFEMRHALFRNGHAFAGARVATHAGRPVIDREAAKAAYLYPVTAHQSIAHGVKNGLDGVFGVSVGQLAETVGQFFNKV
jgi:hypothetical protein